MKSKLKICIEFWNIDLNLLLLMSLCIEDNCFGGLNICLDKADRRSVHKGWSQVHAVNGSIDCTQSRPHPVRFCWHPLVLFLQILNKKINFWIKFFLEMCVWPLFTCFKVQINGNKIISFFFLLKDLLCCFCGVSCGERGGWVVLGSLARFLFPSPFLPVGDWDLDLVPRQKKTGDSVLLLGSDAPNKITLKFHCISKCM